MNNTTTEPLCEGLAPFCCGNPSCPAHGKQEVGSDRIAAALASVGAHAPIPHGSKITVGNKCVRVVYEPDLPTLGLTQDAYDDEGCTTVIRLRAWNERVFLHEVLHVVLGEWLPWFRGQEDWRSLDHTLVDPSEKVTQQVEDALWGMGWRLGAGGEAAEPRAGEGEADLPSRVRDLRARRGLSLREAAAQIGMSFNTLTRIEQGREYENRHNEPLERWLATDDGTNPPDCDGTKHYYVHLVQTSGEGRS